MSIGVADVTWWYTVSDFGNAYSIQLNAETLPSIIHTIVPHTLFCPFWDESIVLWIYAIQIGSSKTASSFHNANFCFVAFPWKSYTQPDPIWAKTSRTDWTSVFCSSLRLTPRAVWISLKLDICLWGQKPVTWNWEGGRISWCGDSAKVMTSIDNYGG